MNRVTRKLLAFVSIAGGGLLGAAPVVAAAPSDPTPAPVPAATSDAPPKPAPTPDPSVRTGRAPAPGDPRGSTGATPPGPVDSPTGPVQTGRATDLAPTGDSSTVPSGLAVPATGPASAAPGPSTPPSRTRSRASAPIPATNDGNASGGKPPTVSVATGPPPPDPTVHATVTGDDLWSIAATELAQVSGRPIASLSNAEVAAYWQRVCDANQAHLRSGDLNLIYPGDQIALPPIGG
jgi:LysM repeat protein